MPAGPVHCGCVPPPVHNTSLYKLKLNLCCSATQFRTASAFLREGERVFRTVWLSAVPYMRHVMLVSAPLRALQAVTSRQSFYNACVREWRAGLTVLCMLVPAHFLSQCLCMEGPTNSAVRFQFRGLQKTLSLIVIISGVLSQSPGPWHSTMVARL
jgi:hypothetical protein